MNNEETDSDNEKDLITDNISSLEPPECEDCIKCGRCFAACEDTSHQAIAMSPDRVFTVKDDECVACNLCVNVCPVQDCITMERLAPGAIDARTGKVVEDAPGTWTTHPNNPNRVAAE